MNNYDCASLVIFYRDASLLFSKSCVQMLEIAHNRMFPPEIFGLIELNVF